MRTAKIVIGANYGDEGKGLMTDYFAGEAAGYGRSCLVVLSNGGAQRGHTVVTPEGGRHVFHHFGSGTLAGADTWLPGEFIVNPMLFMEEMEGLSGMAFPRVFFHPDSPVTTPFDMIGNQIIEEYRGGKRHGSCGMGIWETLLRQGPTLGEMAAFSDPELTRYLRVEVRDYMERRIRQAGVPGIPERWRDIVEDPQLIERYIEDFREMLAAGSFTDVQILEKYDTVIFENGQGLLLDRCRKEYGSHTTPSNTGIRNPAGLIREYVRYLKDGILPGGRKPGTGYGAGTGCIDTRRPAGEGAEDGAGKKSGPEYGGKVRYIACGAEEERKRANPELSVEVCYVSRTYLTRHGAGPFPGECGKEEINPDIVDLTNVPNPHQGTLRFGKLDGKSFLRRVREDFDSVRFPGGIRAKCTLALTHVNEYNRDIPFKADYLSDGETREYVKTR